MKTMRQRHLYGYLSILIVAACTPTSKDVVDYFKVEPMVVPSGVGSAEPFLYKDDSVIYLTWVEKVESSATLKMSRLADLKWSEPAVIATGNNWFVNWADYPMLTAKGQNLAAHFLDRSGEGKYAYDVKLTFSNDGGATWRNPQLLNEDGKQAEHGFVTILPYGDNFFVTWLDGRNAAMEGMAGAGHEGHHGSMTLRAAVVDSVGKKINEWELDNKVCDCCQTTASVTASGPVVVYRDRTDEEIRDMSIVRLIDGNWTTPQPIHNDNWKISGCPVNGPRMANIGDSVAIVWFTAAADSAHAFAVFSHDGGASFGEPIQIDEGKTIGRVDIDLINETTAVVTWMEAGTIKLVMVKKDGTKDPSLTIAESSDARSSGFPQLVVAGNRAIVAWTDGESKAVKSAAVAFQ